MLDKKTPQHICLPADTSMMVFVVPLVIAALIIVVMLVVVCKVKPWRMKEPITFPQSLVSSLIFG